VRKTVSILKIAPQKHALKSTRENTHTTPEPNLSGQMQAQPFLCLHKIDVCRRARRRHHYDEASVISSLNYEIQRGNASPLPQISIISLRKAHRLQSLPPTHPCHGVSPLTNFNGSGWLLDVDVLTDHAISRHNSSSCTLVIILLPVIITSSSLIQPINPLREHTKSLRFPSSGSSLLRCIPFL
jgi:hypothetical protein